MNANFMRAAGAHGAWPDLPLAGTGALFGPGRTLILAPHPDDESLGCGGAIAQLCRDGNAPCVVVLTDGAGSHPNTPSVRLAEIRAEETRAALRALGASPKDLVFLGLRDTAAPHDGPAFQAAVSRLCTLAAGCTTIVAPWRHDPHCDHEAAHKMARDVARLTGLRHLAYPVWGWTLPPETLLDAPFTRGWRLDIADALPAKRRAIAAHRSQHGLVITGDPDGFVLPPAFLAYFDRSYEVYLSP